MDTRKKIPGFSKYTITTDGDIFNKFGKKLKPEKTVKEYLRVTMVNDDGIAKRKYVHCLMMLTFNPLPDSLSRNDYKIHYKNLDRADNRLENLEWVPIAKPKEKKTQGPFNNKWMKERILAYRAGDVKACEEVIKRFTRLIQVYSYRLNYEDAYSSMVLRLLEILNAIDLDRFDDVNHSIQKYIARSIHNEYIHISKKQQEEMKRIKYSVEDCLQSDNPGLTRIMFNYIDIFEKGRLFLQEALSKVTPSQRVVLVYFYIYGYTIAEIGKMLGVSRQSVNGLRLRALYRLRNIYGGGLNNG